jgi:hypothetical protein
MAQDLQTIDRNAKTPSLPRAVISALTNYCRDWSADRALAELASHRADLPRHANVARQSLQPADPVWLADRLSAMQLAMTQGWSEAKATAWLHETQRLLRDVPSDILGWALDEAVKSSVRGFVPSVGEIRAFADPKLADRKRLADRLSVLANRVENDRPGDARTQPADEEDFVPVTPEQMAAIKAEFGLATNPYPDAPKPVGVAPRMPTRADYIAMGVDASILDRVVGKAA